ncbi:unnamed protein product, partial [Prorocentrum cordatum]
MMRTAAQASTRRARPSWTGRRSSCRRSRRAAWRTSRGARRRTSATRALGDHHDEAGLRSLRLSEAVALMRDADQPNFFLAGVRGVKDFLDSVAAGPDVTSHQAEWERLSGVGEGSAVNHVHRNLCEVIRLMHSWDQVDLSMLASAELLVRWMIQTEIAVERNPRHPDYSGLDVVISAPVNAAGRASTSRFNTWVTDRPKERATIWKQGRLYRAEQKQVRKGDGKGGDNTELANPKRRPKKAKGGVAGAGGGAGLAASSPGGIRSRDRRHGDPFPLPCDPAGLGTACDAARLRQVFDSVRALNQLPAANLNSRRARGHDLPPEGHFRATAVQRWMLQNVARRVEAYGACPTDLTEESSLAEILDSRDHYGMEPKSLASFDFDKVKILHRKVHVRPIRRELPPAALGYIRHASDLIERDEAELEKDRAEGQGFSPHWEPRLRRSRDLRKRLCQRLSQQGLLTWRRLLKGRAGIFAVKKKDGLQRLNIDARAANRAHRLPPTTRLGSSRCMADLDLSDPRLKASGFGGVGSGAAASPAGLEGDVGDCFYNFTIPELASWFGFEDRFDTAELGFDTAELESMGCRPATIWDDAEGAETKVVDGEVLYPCMAAVRVGWSWALYFANEAVTYRVEKTLEDGADQIMREMQPTPVLRPGKCVTGVHVDNVQAMSALNACYRFIEESPATLKRAWATCGATRRAAAGPLTAFGQGLRGRAEARPRSLAHAAPGKRARVRVALDSGIPALADGWTMRRRYHLVAADRWRWQDEHINLKEARVALMGLRRHCRSVRMLGSKLLTLSDSQVTVGAFEKGRSSAGLQALCRRAAAYRLGGQITRRLRYIETDRNPSDLDSRQWDAKLPAKQCPAREQPPPAVAAAQLGELLLMNLAVLAPLAAQVTRGPRGLLPPPPLELARESGLLWNFDPIARLRGLPNVIEVNFDMSMYGTAYRKPTRVLTDVEALRALGDKLRIPHEHAIMLHGHLTSQAAAYPFALGSCWAGVLSAALPRAALASARDFDPREIRHGLLRAAGRQPKTGGEAIRGEDGERPEASCQAADAYLSGGPFVQFGQPSAPRRVGAIRAQRRDSLVMATVTNATLERYAAAVHEFEIYAKAKKLDLQPLSRLDDSVAQYFAGLHDDGFGVWEGRNTLCGCRLLRLKATGKVGLPKALASLKGWAKRSPGRMRLPLPDIVVDDIALDLLQTDAYLRPSEVVELRQGQILPPAPAARLGAHYGIVIAPSEWYEVTKTGGQDDSLLVGDTARPWLTSVLRLLHQPKAPDSLKIFDFSFAEYEREVKKSADRLGYSSLGVRPRVFRHSGASNDKAHNRFNASLACLRNAAAQADAAGLGCTALSRDGRFCAAGAHGGARLWDLAAGGAAAAAAGPRGPARAREGRALLGHRGRVLAAAFSPDSELLLTGGQDCSVGVWSTPQGRQLGACPCEGGAVWALDWCAAGHYFVSGGAEGTGLLWSVERAAPLRELRMPGCGAALGRAVPADVE